MTELRSILLSAGRTSPFAVTAGLLFVVAMTNPALSQATAEAIYQPKDELEQAVQGILSKNCARCHQAGKLEYEGKPYRETPAKGFGDVLQLDRLALNPKFIKPGNPAGSELFSKIVNRKMPDDVYTDGKFDMPSPSDDDVKVLEKWINRLGETLVASCSPTGESSLRTITDKIADDLFKQPEERRLGTRYLTFVNLIESCATSKEMEAYRQATVKLLNSLSFSPDVLTAQFIDAQGSALRFHLDDLGWSSYQWDLAHEGYPYAAEPSDSKWDALAEATDDDLPFLRADWFAYTAARPPTYNRILDLPDTFGELEGLLGLNVAQNIASNRVSRAGFQISGVSDNNRLIERHTINTGAFWTSYDFAGNQEHRSLFKFPLGPSADGFAHDGGESIYNLPNGFQAYYLSNASGQSIPEGPINIVKDRERGEPVTNGISCMGCHSEGIKNAGAIDQLRSHVNSNKNDFPIEVRQQVSALYPKKEYMDALIAQDRERFQSALTRAGIDPGFKLGGSEIINALSDRYRRNLDLRTAAAEFGVAIEELPLLLVGAGGQSLHSQLLTASAPRDQFEIDFSSLIARISDAEAFYPLFALRPLWKDYHNYCEDLVDLINRPFSEHRYLGDQSITIGSSPPSEQTLIDRELFVGGSGQCLVAPQRTPSEMFGECRLSAKTEKAAREVRDRMQFEVASCLLFGLDPLSLKVIGEKQVNESRDVDGDADEIFSVRQYIGKNIVVSLRTVKVGEIIYYNALQWQQKP